MLEIPVAAAAITLAAAVLGALLARRFLLHVTTVTAGSMLPTLRPGQRLLTLTAPWPWGVRRGDIVVLHSRELGLDVIKRVVGLPGDEVSISPSGAVAINGQAYPEPYVTRPGGITSRYQVPAGKLFVLGDNRAASSDSRSWREPYLPWSALRGRVVRPRNRPARMSPS